MAFERASGVEEDGIACILGMSSRAPVQRDKASARVWRKRGRGPTMSPLPAIVYTWLIILAHLRAFISARPAVLQVSHQVYSSRSHTQFNKKYKLNVRDQLSKDIKFWSTLNKSTPITPTRMLQ